MADSDGRGDGNSHRYGPRHRLLPLRRAKSHLHEIGTNRLSRTGCESINRHRFPSEKEKAG